MKHYTMKAGVLYFREKMVMRIKSVFTGPEKKILTPGGDLLLQTHIRELEALPEKQRDVYLRQYVMLDADNNKYACANPRYAKGEDPAVADCPVCRIPRLDHAQFLLGEQEYLLIMKNSQNYLLRQTPGVIAAQISHRGITGGWDIEAADDFSPELICGIFIFCRYIEQENEFLTV